MKKRLRSFNIYSSKDENSLRPAGGSRGRPNGGKQKRAAARSRAHQVRAYTAHLRARQTTPPTAQAIVLDQRLLFP